MSFRHFAWTTATALKLVGWVRNLSDGRVEAIAHGPESKLKELHTALTQGPPSARVASIETRDLNWDTPLSNFQITADSEMPIGMH